jgi:hypothetical protein
MKGKTIGTSEETAVDTKSAGDFLTAKELATLKAEIATSRKGMLQANHLPKPIFTYYIR